LLGGRVSEELVFGDVSTGAENDLERATTMAWHRVARYGMSECIGLANCADDYGMQHALAGADGPRHGEPAQRDSPSNAGVTENRAAMSR
jgi:cell division protease FtsH